MSRKMDTGGGTKEAGRPSLTLDGPINPLRPLLGVSDGQCRAYIRRLNFMFIY